MTVKEMTVKIEHETLSPYAKCSDETKGRAHEEKQVPARSDLRTEFQRDRDRVIHCKSFRRLKHKTQVFLSPEGDHYRTRLTHTLEVAQIARTIARALRLNEDLTEAAALAHDLGHTPFGHAGERALNEILSGGFHHYEQSVRIVEVIEKEGKGLNLTHEVRNAIACHTKGQEAETMEGKILRYADKIAYMNHDIDDAIRAGMIKEESLPPEVSELLGRSKSERITAMVTDLVENSQSGSVSFSEDIQRGYDALHDYLYAEVYLNDFAKAEEKKVPGIMEALYKHYENPDNLPDYMKVIAEREGKDIAAADYVSGMTDPFAVQKFEEIFIPRGWQK